MCLILNEHISKVRTCTQGQCTVKFLVRQFWQPAKLLSNSWPYTILCALSSSGLGRVSLQRQQVTKFNNNERWSRWALSNHFGATYSWIWSPVFVVAALPRSDDGGGFRRLRPGRCCTKLSLATEIARSGTLQYGMFTCVLFSEWMNVAYETK